MNKREIIKEAIEAGGATKESLMEVAEVNDKGLASQLTYLRWMGVCPVKGEDGVYKLISAEEWEAIKATRGTGGPAVTLTPAERLDKANKRQGRAASALDKAQTRLDANPDDKLYDLYNTKAMIELQISEILVGRAEADVKDNPAPTPEPVDPDDAPDEVESEVEEEDEFL